MSLSKRFGALLLSGAAVLALGAPAHAAVSSTDAIQQRLSDLQAQIEDLNNTVSDLKRSQSSQYADVQNQRSSDIQFSLKNGRFTAKSSDGDFSLSTRVLLQYDVAYYGGGVYPPGVAGVAAPGAEFSSGSNFRRARIGFSGTLASNWTYEFLYDLGGSGIEGSTISSAFVQYDGLAPFHFKIGAFPAPESFEDSTSAADLIFLERAQPTDLARSIAGSDGRNAATIFAYDDNYFVAASYTAGLAGDAAAFDEQSAAVGRAAYRFNFGQDVNLAVGADATYLFRPADTAVGPLSPHAVRLRERPELNVDSQSIRFIDTGTIDASDYFEWGVEATGNWKSLYGQGGYFNYDVTRRASLLPDPSFSGWYLQGSWILTGEAKPYKPERGAYGSPTPDHPFGKGGAGAWEITARYSDLDLNDNEGVALAATPLGGVRGGEQKIWTGGINWYPNSAIRFVLDYQHTDVERLDGAGADIGAKLDAVSFRMQLSL